MLKPNTGRVLSAVGAGLLILALFLVWYDIDRSAAEGSTTSTGWDTFPRLRVILLVGAALTIVSAFLRQTGPVLIARTVMGLVLALLIARRIVDPPDISAPVHSQIGVLLRGRHRVRVGGADVAAVLGGHRAVDPVQRALVVGQRERDVQHRMRGRRREAARRLGGDRVHGQRQVNVRTRHRPQRCAVGAAR